MENNNLSKPLVVGVSLVIGLALLGFFVFKGLKTFSDKDRVVAVKGLAEMNMMAKTASIQLRFTFSGDDLKSVIQQTEAKKSSVVTYLKSQGYTEKDIVISTMDVSDNEKYYDFIWIDGKRQKQKINRYVISQSITLHSKSVENARTIASKIELDLITRNLTCSIHTSYTFPDLNSIKPKLIAESTKNARIAGEQFANDSQATLGKIKTASQGQISIAGEYSEDGEASEKPNEPYLQKARVVSTIVFFLE